MYEPKENMNTKIKGFHGKTTRTYAKYVYSYLTY